MKKKAYSMIYAFFGVENMRRVIGYTLFCIGFGMLVMFLLPSKIAGFLLICGCMIAGYYLFCCE